MLTSLEIKNFKCFAHLTIAPLAKVNLFVGTSNSGKTAVLEAVHLLPHKGMPVFPGFRDASLGSDLAHSFDKWLFHDLNESSAIEISSVQTHAPNHLKVYVSDRAAWTGHQHVASTPSGKCVVWTADSKGRWPKIAAISTDRAPSVELAKKYDAWTRRAENDDRFVEFLSKVDHRVKSLRPMEHTGTRMLYADVRLPERIALPLLGEGFNRLVQIFGSIIGEDADILLIDEIENGLHWSALPQIWTGIREAVNKEEVQIFATTHSLECIATAVEAFKGEPKNDLAVHRLERTDAGDIRCVTMNEDELERMLARGWEVR